jgi:hypothetical protein
VTRLAGNKPNSKTGLLNKISSLDAALGVTKFITANGMSMVSLFVPFKSDLDIQQPTSEGSLWYKSSSLAAALGATKFITANAKSLVTL